MSEYFIIDGVDSSDFGIVMVNNRVYNKSWIPKNKITTESLPLQVGNRYIDSHHDSKVIDIRCYMENNHESHFNEVSRLLAKNKQVKLILSTELHKEYTAVLENEVNPDLFINGATFNLRYIAHFPYAKSRFSTGDIIDNGLIYDSNYYYNSGLLYDINNDNGVDYSFLNITTTTDFEIHNGSNVDGSRPNIIIDGSADAIIIKQFKTNSRIDEINRVSYGSFSGILEINCLLRDAFLNGGLNNSTFDGRYFELETDYNYFTIEGTNMNISELKFDFKFLYV